MKPTRSSPKSAARSRRHVVVAARAFFSTPRALAPTDLGVTHLSARLRNAVLRLADAPQRTLSNLASRVGPSSGVRPPVSVPPPEHLTRLESVFEALSELPEQPHVAAAFELACDTLQAELPTQAVAAGLYDIDADQIRFVAARGAKRDALCGSAMPRARCLSGYAADEAIITGGGPDEADWIGSGEEGSTVLLCPILYDANLLGVLALADPSCTAHFSKHDMDLVRYVAEQLAGFIHAHRQRSRRGSHAAR
jgi:GAF domain